MPRAQRPGPRRGFSFRSKQLGPFRPCHPKKWSDKGTEKPRRQDERTNQHGEQHRSSDAGQEAGEVGHCAACPPTARPIEDDVRRYPRNQRNQQDCKKRCSINNFASAFHAQYSSDNCFHIWAAPFGKQKNRTLKRGELRTASAARFRRPYRRRSVHRRALALTRRFSQIQTHGALEGSGSSRIARNLTSPSLGSI